MLDHPTHHQLRELRLDGMADAFAELQAQDGAPTISATLNGLGLLIDREASSRSTKKYQSRMRAAKLRHVGASVEDVDFRAGRKLDKVALSATRQRALDRRKPVPFDHRPMRRRQDLAGLCPRATRLPRWHECALPPRPPPLRRSRTCPWRRAVPPSLPPTHESRPPHPRRLGALIG